MIWEIMNNFPFFSTYLSLKSWGWSSFARVASWWGRFDRHCLVLKVGRWNAGRWEQLHLLADAQLAWLFACRRRRFIVRRRVLLHQRLVYVQISRLFVLFVRMSGWTGRRSRGQHFHIFYGRTHLLHDTCQLCWRNGHSAIVKRIASWGNHRGLRGTRSRVLWFVFA